MILDEDKIYTKIIAHNKIYNFIVLSFLFEEVKIKNNYIKFQNHNNRVLVLAALEK